VTRLPPSRTWLVGSVVVVTMTLLATGCSGDGASTPTAGATGTPTASTTDTPALAPRAEAAALVSSRPRPFDAVYRLDSKGDRPDATVRVRIDGFGYRVDVTRGGSTASLLTTRTGLVSCQVDGRDRACFLVAKKDQDPPPLFDPGVQRIFLDVVPVVADGGSGVRIRRAGVWKAPPRYGTAQCYEVTGKVRDPGVYCFLTDGRWAGALARAEFASGSLSLRRIDGRFDHANTYRPPVRPTPLPD
jgi:hypothetical protein